MIIRQSTLDNGQFLSIMINSKCDKANKNQPKQNLEHWWTSNVWHFYNLFGINPSEFQEFSRKYYESCVRPTILDMSHTQTVPQEIYCKFLWILTNQNESWADINLRTKRIIPSSLTIFALSESSDSLWLIGQRSADYNWYTRLERDILKPAWTILKLI